MHVEDDGAEELGGVGGGCGDVGGFKFGGEGDVGDGDGLGEGVA